MGNIPAWLCIDIYTLIIAALLCVLACDSDVRRRKENLTFNAMLVIIVLLSLADIASGMKSVLANAAMCFIFVYDPIFQFLSVMYIRFWINDETVFTRMYFKILCLITIIHTILVLASTLFNLKWFYYYDANMEYHRGRYHDFRMIFLLTIFLVIEIYLIVKRKAIPSKYRATIVAYPIIGITGGLMQGITTLPTEYAGMAVVCIILMIFVKNRDLRIDYLTGAYNRRSLDIMLEDKINNLGKGFAAIMVDLDFFKLINDKFGHDVGDEALMNVYKILNSSIGSKDVVARYGGDEFVVIVNVSGKEELENVVKRIRQNMENFNHDKRAVYEINMSMGYLMYDEMPEGCTLSQYMVAIDERMYKEKELHHKGL